MLPTSVSEFGWMDSKKAFWKNYAHLKTKKVDMPYLLEIFYRWR